MGKSKERISCSLGLTVAESMIAAAILAIAVTAIFGMINTTDRIRGRRDRIINTSFVISNETERIKKTAARWDTLSDTAYETLINEMAFEVQRKVKPIDPLIQTYSPYAREVEIRIRRVGIEDKEKVFRLIQGYSK